MVPCNAATITSALSSAHNRMISMAAKPSAIALPAASLWPRSASVATSAIHTSRITRLRMTLRTTAPVDARAGASIGVCSVEALE
jgi:hypothetical protein